MGGLSLLIRLSRACKAMVNVRAGFPKCLQCMAIVTMEAYLDEKAFIRVYGFIHICISRHSWM